MPVIRVSEATYARLKKYAAPFENTPDKVIARALSALDEATGEPLAPVLPAAQYNGARGPKLPQKEFRVPLLVTLLDLGGMTPSRTVREHMQLLMAHRLEEGDYVCSSAGDARWWSAVCWLRINMIEEGLMKRNSTRGIWEISKQGRALRTSYRRRTSTGDRTIAQGTLEEMAQKYRETPRLIRREYFLKVGETVFHW